MLSQSTRHGATNKNIFVSSYMYGSRTPFPEDEKESQHQNGRNQYSTVHTLPALIILDKRFGHRRYDIQQGHFLMKLTKFLQFAHHRSSSAIQKLKFFNQCIYRLSSLITRVTQGCHMADNISITTTVGRNGTSPDYINMSGYNLISGIRIQKLTIFRLWLNLVNTSESKTIGMKKNSVKAVLFRASGGS